MRVSILSFIQITTMFKQLLLILTAQPPGAPEITKKCFSEVNPEGGQELFIIGKNFSKGSKAYFVENDADGKEVWSAEADIDQDNFHQVRLDGFNSGPTRHEVNSILSIPVPLNPIWSITYPWSSGSVLDHRSLQCVFESRHGHI